jgi:hypothetical protein
MIITQQIFLANWNNIIALESGRGVGAFIRGGPPGSSAGLPAWENAANSHLSDHIEKIGLGESPLGRLAKEYMYM